MKFSQGIHLSKDVLGAALVYHFFAHAQELVHFNHLGHHTMHRSEHQVFEHFVNATVDCGIKLPNPPNLLQLFIGFLDSDDYELCNCLSLAKCHKADF